MSNVHKEAHQRIFQCLIAALIVKPLDPGLTQAELQDVVVGSGISIAVFNDIVADVMRRKAVAGSMGVSIQGDLLQLLMPGDGHYPIDLFPRAPIAALRSAFEELDREFGKRRPKTLSVIISKCAAERKESVELALGMAVALGFVKHSEHGYILDSDLDDLLAQPHRAEPHPWVPAIKALIPMVEATMAKRSGSLVPTLSPTDRFHRFLVKQGWSEFATWWALTSREMESACAYHPTAATVLAGALLEGALVAIAEPAKVDGEWRNKFLNDPPAKWKLNQLVDQAEAAGTFSGPDAALARNLAELRNRIHAGKYSTAGIGPFRPPSTNAHEAHLARLHLERVLDIILGWSPVLKRS